MSNLEAITPVASKLPGLVPHAVGLGMVVSIAAARPARGLSPTVHVALAAGVASLKVGHMRLCNDVEGSASGDAGEATGGAGAHDFVVEFIAGPLSYCLGALQLPGKADACEDRQQGHTLPDVSSGVRCSCRAWQILSHANCGKLLCELVSVSRGDGTEAVQVLEPKGSNA